MEVRPLKILSTLLFSSLLAVLLSSLSACGGDSAGNTSGDGTPAGASGAASDPGSAGSPDPAPVADSEFGTPNNGQIRPGVIVSAMGSQCTSNFIYSDGTGTYYIGAAAHCFSPDTNSGIDPCEARNEPLGTPVEIQNADFLGTLAYSSWQTMQDEAEQAGSGICTGNDFALVKIDPRDRPNVHPAALVFGGPTALFQGNAAVGDQVFSYGQSPLQFGIRSLESKEGVIVAQTEDGWLYTINTDNPGLPGDSGSAVLHESGRALGVLSTVGVCLGLCPAVSNSAVNLEMALAYANANVFRGRLSLVTWQAFSP